MNLITTIPMREKHIWVDALFKKGPHKGFPLKRGPHKGVRAPVYPPEFPFSRNVKRGEKIRFLYVVYKGHIIGYGRVAKYLECGVESVGLIPEDVGPGSKFVLIGPLKHMHRSCPIPYKGFRNFRYVEENLHLLTAKAALRAVQRRR